MILAPGIQVAAAIGCALLAIIGLLLEPGTLWSSLSLVASGSLLAVTPLCLLGRRHLHDEIERAIGESEDLRRQAMGAASSHAAQVQAIVDTATEGIVTIDDTGTIVTFNGAAERLFHFTAAEAIGNSVNCLMPRPFSAEHDGYLQRYLETGEKRIIGFGREVVGRRKDGSLFPIDLSIGEGWSDGQRFFTAVIRDITERHEMQAKLTQTERLAAVGELAAGIAHEVNNPINTMINCAQLIQDGDEPQENSQIIVEEGQRIADIVRDLLQFARDDRDQPQPTALHDVVERTLRLMGENLKRHGIQLTVEVPDEIPQVMARPQQVQQVLLNLLINAKDALLTKPESRNVTLFGGSDGEFAHLGVQDNGPGIPDELGSRIFEPFVTTKRARGGTGLGLSISKSIIEGYGGRIELDTKPGTGATFRICLPVAERE
ncbi:MAG: PAS domain S-box protein [Planctomycetes bacterium]|nr:PAS domain S-box protein [Planctomycetota bacterium]